MYIYLCHDGNIMGCQRVFDGTYPSGNQTLAGKSQNGMDISSKLGIHHRSRWRNFQLRVARLDCMISWQNDWTMIQDLLVSCSYSIFPNFWVQIPNSSKFWKAMIHGNIKATRKLHMSLSKQCPRLFSQKRMRMLATSCIRNTLRTGKCIWKVVSGWSWHSDLLWGTSL